jgi:hypothetical protein
MKGWVRLERFGNALGRLIADVRSRYRLDGDGEREEGSET